MENEEAVFRQREEEGSARCVLPASRRQDPRVRQRDRQQAARRVAEHRLRETLLERASALRAGGVSWRESARALHVPERTLRDWRSQPPNDFRQLKRRGRPCAEVSSARRSEVFQLLQLTGPLLGLPTLRAIFKDLPRVALERLLMRYRRWWRRKHGVDGRRLTWLVPGAVWAMDFTEPPFKIDARYPYLFTVRDLASRYHICWRPVATQKAEELIPILRELFRQHGCPLVMKSDNGSAFIAEATAQVFAEWMVCLLYSPPRKPKYNGALERSNTTMKSWTAASAHAAGRPMHWTSADLQQALRIANQLERPWGPEGPTPGEVWRGREELSAERRQELLVELIEERPKARKQLGFDTLDEDEVSQADRRQIDRVALSAILQRLAYLKVAPVRRAPDKPRRCKLSLSELKKTVFEQDRPSPTPDQDRAGSEAPARDPSPGNDDHCPSTPPSLTTGDNAIGDSVAAQATTDSHRGAQAPRLGKALAHPSEGVTMHEQQAGGDPRAAPPQAATPAHRARAFFTWLRRPITLLISLFKAAKIP